MRTSAAFLACAALCGGCVGQLDPASIVKTPRVLAIVANPPEAAPGTDHRFTAMVSVPSSFARPLSLRWSHCLTPESLLEASGIMVDLVGNPPCPPPSTLSEEEPFLLSGATVQGALDLLSLAGQAGYDTRVVDQLIATAGLAFEVELEVLDAEGNVLVQAFKRAAVTTRSNPGTNPPAPEFDIAIGENTLAIVRENSPFVCTSIDGTIPSIPAGAHVALVPPSGRPGAAEESWLESFPIYDYTGGITIGNENAYYSWFATGGSLVNDSARPPNRVATWATPSNVDRASVWLVMRDGHLGASGCRLDVELTL